MEAVIGAVLETVEADFCRRALVEMCPSSWGWSQVLASHLMHILIRRSSLLSMSHALAWQTTLAIGRLVKSDRSQNVGGSLFESPSEVKKPSPYFTMPLASRFFFLKQFGDVDSAPCSL